MAHADKYVGVSEGQTCTKSMQTDVPVSTLSREKLISLIQLGEKSVFEAAKRKQMRSVLRNLVEKTMCDVLATGCRAATEGVKSPSFRSWRT